MARDLALICLLYTSLLRRSEAANTNWGNISKQAEHYWLNIPIAKGGQRQKVKLESVAISLLKKYLEVMGDRSRLKRYLTCLSIGAQSSWPSTERISLND